MIFCGTDSVGTTVVGVVTSDIHGAAGLPSNDWGWLQIRGYCAKINVGASVTINHALKTTNGAVYAPNGTVVDNYYTSFGVTRKEIDFVLGTSTTDVTAKIEEGIAHQQDNQLSGDIISGSMVLCSPEFFAKLIAQAGVKEAYKYYQSLQDPLRQRLGSGLYRRFSHGGMDFVEYRGSYNGVRLIPAGDAYAVPMGTTDTFISYFGPANKLALANTMGEEAYVFQYRDPRDEGILLQSESSHLSLVRRPGTVVRLFSSN